MGTWWKLQEQQSNNGEGYVNSDHVEALIAAQREDDLWAVQAQMVASTQTYELEGAFAAQVDAVEMARRLVRGFDPDSVT